MPIKTDNPYCQLEQTNDLSHMCSINMMHMLHMAFKALPGTQKIYINLQVDGGVTLRSEYMEVEGRPGVWRRTEYLFVDEIGGGFDVIDLLK